MTKTLLRAGLLPCALLATTALTAPALAQSVPQPTIHKALDANSVDLVTGRLEFGIPVGSIGAGDGLLTLAELFGSGEGHSLQAFFWRTESGGQAHISVIFGNSRETFSGSTSATSFASAQGSGATLTKISASQYSLTAADGTVTTFAWPSNLNFQGGGAAFCSAGNELSCDLLPQTMTTPTGRRIAWNFYANENCSTEFDQHGEPIVNCVQYYRLVSVTNSNGYRVVLTYVNNQDPAVGQPDSNWYRRSGATFHNLTVGSQSLASSSYAYPSSTVTEITDTGGGTWRVSRSTAFGPPTGVRRPGSSTDDVAISWSNNRVSSITADGVTTSYSYSTSGSTQTTTVTNALNQQTVVSTNLNVGRPSSITDPLNRTTGFQYDSSARLTRVTQPEGNYVEYTYDSRGNVSQTQAVPKSGSGSATLTTSATYPSSCANPITCNFPTSTTDARGNTTDYSWDSTHGGLLSVTAPEPTAGATRPQTRFSYAQTASPVSGFPSVSLPTEVSACQSGTSSTCVGTANEARTVIAYNSNLLPSSVTRRNGNNSLSAASALAYDGIGNLLTVDGPLSGTADTVRMRYDGGRRRVGLIGPDPDGGGSLKHRAVRTTYRSDGLATKVERGTVNSQSDSDWASFAVLEEVQIGYDANDRPTTRRLAAGGTTHALTQTGYDGLGRVQCVATRMNPAGFASPPSSACALGTAGGFGDDRIVRTTYDAAGQVTLVQTGYGVAGVQADEVATAFTNNGRVAHVTDAEGNRTTYEYDGHDRLVKTRYPSPTVPGTSSTTDYEESTLDANGNVTTFRERDATSITMTYDALNRLTGKNYVNWTPDRAYVYDLLGRLTRVSWSGHVLQFTYDALGRNLTQVSPLGTVSYQYDLAGRRTRLTYPGTGLYVDYDYLVTGEVTKVRENGATSGIGVLATYGYDDLGRRTSLTRGNGTATTYSYDAVSRLSQLVQDPAGTTHDLTLGFSYNPASQIVSNTRSNDLYAWTGHYGVARSYGHNGLNQITQIVQGAATTNVSHDGRGNISAIGSASYGYDRENLLTSAPGGVTLGYDPAMRLYQTSDGTVTTRFLYDGVTMIAEYNGSNALQRRYVHGPGVDEPLVWYEGTGTTDRRWLHQDERGSVVAISNGSGAVTNVNTYDEYGIPGSANVGRFQYTGQAWIPELGMYHYRARIYSPTLGRFMQPDPIGYRGGMNLYAYVGNDPVNWTDPLGLCRGTELHPIVCQTLPNDVGTSNFWTTFDIGGGGGGGEGSTTGPNDECVGGTEGAGCIIIVEQARSPFRARRTLRGPLAVGGGGPENESRYLTLREERLFICSGVDPARLEGVRLHPRFTDLAARLAGLRPSTRAVAIGSDIYYRRGVPGRNDIFSDLNAMRMLAEEIGHVIQYAQGMTIVDYLLDAVTRGYDQSIYENNAKGFADHVVSLFEAGTCTGSSALAN